MNLNDSKTSLPAVSENPPSRTSSTSKTAAVENQNTAKKHAVSAADSHQKDHLESATARPAKAQVASITALTQQLAAYLSESDLKLVKEAYRFSDEMHLGQIRRSGEPYISHPIAVAEICADWKLDVQAIMAALLHDVMEDQDVTKDELIERFGAPVASLVDGLSKLEKIEFQSHIEAQAENFRKMLLAMARDVRVILVKLADRLHNMRTLGVMSPEKRRRISRETMEVYVPIAHRLGLNNLYRELQDLSFAHTYPMRYRTLSKAVKAARGNRREVVNKVMESVKATLAEARINAQVYGREKTLYGIYRKMRDKNLSFSQVLDVYGFRVVVNDFRNSYYALGTLHALYKPMPGKFKDYIAIPKTNGYQSLHTTLIGPYGTPVEFQIRTQDMHHVAESGVAAHWLYKNEEGSLNELQQRTHAWLQSLLDIQKQTGDSAEFLEHVKVDLFPDSVYVFTPKSKIIALPRGATALDFAYSIHTDIGDQAIATRINNDPVPLRSELKNGDIVEIITSPDSRPTPNWLTYVRTGKARSAIRHYLRTINLNESTELGRQLLAQALVGLSLNPELHEELVERLLNESSAKTMDEIYTDIGIGTCMAALVARHILDLVEDDSPSIPLQQFGGDKAVLKRNAVMIYGSEGLSVQLAPCCLPIPGDGIVGQLKRDQGLIVHTAQCNHAKRLHSKEPDRWIDVMWGQDLNRRFDTRIAVTAFNERGSLARITAEISESDANISHVNMEYGDATEINTIHFTIQIEDRVHLAKLMRNIKHLSGVNKIWREHN
jgi:GTP diphosphokinase / guanosine-3',5'-bis(diphosphate) 3'-diphosphatase